MEIKKSHKAFGGEVRFYQHQSLKTKTKMHFSAFIPQGKIKAGLFWLSGLTCNEENFITKAGALPFLNDAGICLICPDTSPRGLNLKNEHQDWDFGSGASFYVNALTEGYSDHYNMYDYILELYEIINQEFDLKKMISISGHSMGGHGALCFGLKVPDLFVSVSAFSPIVNPMSCPWGKKAFSGYLGEDHKKWKEYDTCALLQDGYFHQSPFLITQGTRDEFLDTQLKTSNITNAAKESKQKIHLKYEEGYDHSYYFISSFIKQHIDFHKEYLLMDKL